jgi:outer membrane protein assembly factor BamB
MLKSFSWKKASVVGLLVATAAAAAVLYLCFNNAGSGKIASSPSEVNAAGKYWPTYGGDIWNSFTLSSSSMTVSNINQMKQDWFTPADGEVSGNPAIANSVVYFTTDAGSVYAVSEKSGALIWKRGLDGSPINSGPLYDQGRIFISTSGGRIYALNPKTGGEIWKTGALFGSLPDALRASPKVWNGVIYQSLGGTDDNKYERGGVVAVDEKTGYVLWREDLVQYAGGGSAVFGPPAIIPQLNELVVSTGNPTPYPTNGDAANRGSVPSGSDYYSDSLVALSLKDGHILWAKQVHSADANDYDFIAAPNALVLPKGGIAVGAGDKDGTYYLFDAKTGGLLWKKDLGAFGATTLIMSTAAASDNAIFAETMDVTALASSWPQKYQSPAVGRVIKLEADSGRVIWSTNIPAALVAAPAVDNNLVFAIGANGTLFALNADNGAIVWQNATGGQIWNAEAALAAAGNAIFAPLSGKNGVIAFTDQ